MEAVLHGLAGQVRGAAAAGTALCIRGGGTKDFYGNPPRGEPLETGLLQGVIDYQPSELVVTVRAGTSLAGLESLLGEHGQMLAFEPPHFGATATVGGCVAAGLAGPRRASAGTSYGGIGHFLLGARLLDGRGRILSLGGTVMKNVAGYDLARALAGSLGILGVIAEVSLKVLPRPARETTLRFGMGEADALQRLNGWAGRPLPISASAWCDGVLWLRLSGAPEALRDAERRLGGEPVADDGIWSALREQQHPFFAGDEPLWRLSLPSTAAAAGLGGAQLIEWGGALRWLRSGRPAPEIHARALQLGGHASLFRGGDRSQGVFAPLTPALAVLHKRLKAEFDPAGIFNPGRMYAEL